jgi:hypothetical protein
MIVPSSVTIVGPGSAVVVVVERAMTRARCRSSLLRQAEPTTIAAATTRADALCRVRLSTGMTRNLFEPSAPDVGAPAGQDTYRQSRGRERAERGGFDRKLYRRAAEGQGIASRASSN